MHASYLSAVLFTVGALSGPILGQRSLPGGVKHLHGHSAFHKHDVRDTPAEQLIDELQSAGIPIDIPDEVVQSPAQSPAQTPTPTPAPSPVNANSPPAGQNVKVVYVTEVVDQNGNEVQPAAPPPSSAPSPSPTPSAPAQPVVHVEQPPKPQEQPTPQEQPAPQVQSTPQSQPSSTPQAKPSPASPWAGLPSAPTEFLEELSAEDPVYKALVLLHHNIHRTNHSLPPLEWNETLFEYAKNSAQSCVYEHTQPTPPYGQNIAAGNAPGNVSADITNGFYNGEIGLFLEAIGEFGNDSPNMADFEHWGHATQILWKETTSVACYTAACFPSGNDPQACGPQGSYLKNVGCGNGGTRAFNLVCNYYPPGNYPNQYSAVPGPADVMGFVQMTANGVVGLPSDL